MLKRNQTSSCGWNFGLFGTALLLCSALIAAQAYSAPTDDKVGTLDKDLDLALSKLYRRSAIAKSKCISSHWERVPIFVHSNTTLEPSAAASTLNWAGVGIKGGSSELIRTSGRFIKGLGVRTASRSDLEKSTLTESREQIFEMLVKHFKRHADQEEFDDLRKICLAQCLVSSLIEYDDEMASVPSASCAIQEGRAVCTGYSLLTRDVARRFGVEENKVQAEFVNLVTPARATEGNTTKSVQQHAVVRLNIRGKNYLMDPLNTGCDLYTTEYRDLPNSKVIGSFKPMVPKKASRTEVSSPEAQSVSGSTSKVPESPAPSSLPVSGGIPELGNGKSAE